MGHHIRHYYKHPASNCEVIKMAESEEKTKSPFGGMDPGAITAAMFAAYKGECDCETCSILRSGIEGVVQTYLPKKPVKRQHG